MSRRRHALAGQEVDRVGARLGQERGQDVAHVRLRLARALHVQDGGLQHAAEGERSARAARLAPRGSVSRFSSRKRVELGLEASRCRPPRRAGSSRRDVSLTMAKSRCSRVRWAWRRETASRAAALRTRSTVRLNMIPYYEPRAPGGNAPIGRPRATMGAVKEVLVRVAGLVFAAAYAAFIVVRVRPPAADGAAARGREWPPPSAPIAWTP